MIIDMDHMTIEEKNLKTNLTRCVTNRQLPEENQLDQLTANDAKYENDLLKGIPLPSKCYITYFAVCNKTIIGVFFHMYSNNEAWLCVAYIHRLFRKLGYGELIYNKIKQDIFKNTNAPEIGTAIVSESGKNFCKKVGFMVNIFSTKENLDEKLISAVLPKESEKDNEKYRNYVSLNEFLIRYPVTLDGDFDYKI